MASCLKTFDTLVEQGFRSAKKFSVQFVLVISYVRKGDNILLFPIFDYLLIVYVDQSSKPSKHSIFFSCITGHMHSLVKTMLYNKMLHLLSSE